MKSIARFLVPFIAFAGISLSAGTAAANYDYICYARLHPGSGSLGANGYLLVSLNKEPDCLGAFVGTYYLCTTGATSSACASSIAYRYTEAQLNTQYLALTAAQRGDQRVSFNTGACNGGTSGCATTVYIEDSP